MAVRCLPAFPLLLACLTTGVAVGNGARAAEVTLQAVLSPQVSALLKRPPGTVHLGLLVRDLDTGKVLEAARPDELFVPASTMKLVSMAARLSQGPQSRYSVEALAPAQEVSRHAKRLSRLTLRGLGDPSLSLTGPYSLAALARQLAKIGIEEVGELSTAPSIDSATWPALPLGTPLVPLRLQEYPGWNDTPEDYAARVTGAFAGQLRAAGIRVGTAASGLGRSVGQQSVQQWNRVLPGDSAAPGAASTAAPEISLARVQGQPLISLVQQTLKPSDNVWADQLAARLGQVPGQASAEPLTHAGMLAGLRRFLVQVGVKPAPLSLSDASGLSAANRLTPRTLVTVLERMYDLPITNLKTPLTPTQAFAQRKNLFIEALPRGGTGSATQATRTEGGTLAGRFVGSGLDVRAKTGTLPGASSLAGYVRSKSGHVLAFAVMVDQAPGNTLDLRAYQDRLLKVIARSH